MKMHFKLKRVVAVSAACLIFTVLFVSCDKNSISEESIKKPKMESEIAMNSDTEKESDLRIECTKGSDENDLVTKTISGTKPAINTAGNVNEIKAVHKQPESKNESNNGNIVVKPVTNTESNPVGNQIIKPETKPVDNPMTEPDKKKVWVVDQKGKPAWDEEVEDHNFPTGYNREYFWIEGKGINEKYYSEDEQYERLDELADEGLAVSWGNDFEFVQTGYMKTTIHHPAVPEKGHWEWK